jgi:hypothetical protein
MLGIAFTAPTETARSLLPIADVAALTETASRDRLDLEARQFVLVLPGDAGAVVLRALSRSEWAGYQVRAMAWDAIEREMLATCLVSPAITSSDAAAIPEALALLLKRAVNEASGFAVFPDASLRPAGG